MSTLIKDKKTGTYKIRYNTGPGTTKTISTRETDKASARKVAKNSKIAELEQAAKTGRITQEVISRIITDKKVTLLNAINEYRAWMGIVGRSPVYIENSIVVLTSFANESELGWKPLANRSLTEIDESHVYKFINAPSLTKASWRRIKLVNLNQFFEFAAAKGWVFSNPAKLVRVRMDTLSHAQKETRQRRPFTDKEVDKLLDATELGSFWHTAIAIGRYTGLRLGDIAKLEWDSFATPKKIIVWTDKRDRRVSLPLTPRKLIDAIAAIPPVNMKYVFPEERAVMLDLKKRANLSTYFRRLCEKVGIEDKTFHDLRSAYASECKKKGVPMPHIAQSLGHSSTKTTEGYCK